MKKKAIILIVITIVAGFIYIVFPTNSTKMHNIFQEYLENNISDYKDYDECLFGLYDGPSSSGGKGYGGFGKYYEIEYCHKQHGIRLRLNTDGYEIHDNYDEVKKQIKFIEYAMKIFNERISDDRVKIHTMNLTENDDYENTKPTKKYVEAHLEMFSPQIDLLAENMDYEEFKAIDEQISQLFSNIRTYTIIDSKEKSVITSVNLEEFKKYKTNDAKTVSDDLNDVQNVLCYKGIEKSPNDNSINIQTVYSHNNDIEYVENDNLFQTRAAEQYAYPAEVNVGSYGTAKITVICNINKSSETISFNSFGNYSVKFNNSSDTVFSLKSRTCTKKDNYLLLKCKFTITNLNTHKTSETTTQTKITYNDVRKFNNW